MYIVDRKIMGFQRVCAPFGGVFRGKAPKSQTNLFVLSRRAKLPLPSKTEREVRKPTGFRVRGKVPLCGTFRQCFALSWTVTVPPCMVYAKNIPLKRSGGTF